MANYKQSSQSGSVTSYKRAKSVKIDNKLNAAPAVVFTEEVMKILPDNSTVSSPAGELSAIINDNTQSFSLLNPADGSATGVSMSYAQLYQALYSAYIAIASLRDAAIVANPKQQTPVIKV